MLDFTAVYPAGSLVSLSNNEVGVVIKQNRQFPERPILRIVKDSEGKSVDEERICDLLQVHTLFIEKVIM